MTRIAPRRLDRKHQSVGIHPRKVEVMRLANSLCQQRSRSDGEAVLLSDQPLDIFADKIQPIVREQMSIFCSQGIWPISLPCFLLFSCPSLEFGGRKGLYLIALIQAESGLVLDPLSHLIRVAFHWNATFPDASRVIKACRDDPTAIGAEFNRVHPFVMLQTRAEATSSCGIPQLCGSVCGRRVARVVPSRLTATCIIRPCCRSGTRIGSPSDTDQTTAV